MKSARWSLLFLAMAVNTILAADGKTASPDDAFRANKRLGRGINLGNALEAPSEGTWGLTLKAEYFDRIKEAGFQSVRIPIRWPTHTGPGPDYNIDPAYFARVDWAIDQALSRGLVAIINSHHEEELRTRSPTSTSLASKRSGGRSPFGIKVGPSLCCTSCSTSPTAT